MSFMKNRLYDGYHKYDREVAQTYDQSRQQERHWILEDRFVGKYMRSRPVEDLLDLPVGTGRFFHHYTGVRNVTGIDISEEMLLLAKEKLFLLPPEVSVCLEQGDVFALPFVNAAFDVTIVFRLFHLMPETSLARAIKELCRVTRKDVVVQTYVPEDGLRNPFQMRFRAAFRKLKSLFQHRNPSQAQPWCHIQAYYHKQAIVDAEFAVCGFSPSGRELLDKYENCDVNVTIYSRKI